MLGDVRIKRKYIPTFTISTAVPRRECENNKRIPPASILRKEKKKGKGEKEREREREREKEKREKILPYFSFLFFCRRQGFRRLPGSPVADFSVKSSRTTRRLHHATSCSISKSAMFCIARIGTQRSAHPKLLTGSCSSIFRIIPSINSLLY
jgi:hypothetical protein